MNKQQLETSIAKITEAITIIMGVEGYSYDAAHKTTQLMIDERNKMQHNLRAMEWAERKAKRTEAKMQEPFDVVMYDQPMVGYTAVGSKAEVIGEQKVNFEGRVLEQYIYTIEGHAGNYISLKANIAI